MKIVFIVMIIVLSTGNIFAASYGINLGLSMMNQYIDYTNKIAPVPDPLWSSVKSQNYFNAGLFF
jgi:hypothetical protein